MTLFFIKLIHTVIFFVMTASILYLLYSGVMNRGTRWTVLAVILIFVEGIALLLNDWKCPLTTWAENLGAVNGSVSDIFLPHWLADHLFSICTPLFAVGFIMLIIRRLLNRRSANSTGA
jgi:hypothetical protein